MQSRHLAAHHYEARPGDTRGGLEVEPAEPLADLHVITYGKVEPARLTPARHLAVGALIVAVGHRLVQQVGEPQLPLLELALHALELALRARELRCEILAARYEDGYVRSAGLGHPDRLGVGIALGAQPVYFHRPGLALFLQCPQRA